MTYPFPPSDLITPQGIVGALIVFFVVLCLTKQASHSKQSWIPALIFAIMSEIAISLAVKGGIWKLGEEYLINQTS